MEIRSDCILTNDSYVYNAGNTNETSDSKIYIYHNDILVFFS